MRQILGDIKRAVVSRSFLIAFAGMALRRVFGRSGIEFPLEIYQMLLTTWPVRERNGDDILLMPCWFVFFDGDTEAMDRITGVFDEETIQRRREEARADLGMTHGVLVLNAVDGSIVHTDYGY